MTKEAFLNLDYGNIVVYKRFPGEVYEIIFRDSKRIYKPQKLSVSGVFLLSIIVFSCGETQKILYRKQRVNSR